MTSEVVSWDANSIDSNEVSLADKFVYRFVISSEELTEDQARALCILYKENADSDWVLMTEYPALEVSNTRFFLEAYCKNKMYSGEFGLPEFINGKHLIKFRITPAPTTAKKAFLLVL